MPCQVASRLKSPAGRRRVTLPVGPERAAATTPPSRVERTYWMPWTTLPLASTPVRLT